MNQWLVIFGLFLAGCQHLAVREPSSIPAPKSQSFSFGQVPNGSDICRILVSFDQRDLDSCLFGFHINSEGKFVCNLQNPLVKPGSEGALEEQVRTKFLLFSSGVESARLKVFPDHLEIVVTAANIGRAQMLLRQIRSIEGRTRMVKYLVSTDSCLLH